MIPPSLLIPLASALVALILGVGTGWTMQGWRMAGKIEQERASHAQAVADAASAARAQSEAHRRTEQALSSKLAEEAAHARTRTAALEADARALADARDRLRVHLVRYAVATSADGPDSAPAIGGAAATGPGLVFAELYRSADDEAAGLAVAFDRARSAGLACQQSYDAARAALTKDHREQ